MKEEDYLKIVDESSKRRKKIHHKKTGDYATEDVLSNFKRVAQMMDILKIDPTVPHGVACIYILLKMDRFCNLVFRKKTKPANEAVEDTLDDWKNYLDLMEANYKEWKRDQKESSPSK